MTRRAITVAAALCVVLAGCRSGEEAADGPAEPSPTATTSEAPPSGSSAAPEPELPVLASPPATDQSLWLDTIGVQVVAAVRTSTPLAELAEVAPPDRPGVCRSVAAELDTIAPPTVLTGLAITADAETATLLVSDLQAKSELLAACGDGEDGRLAELIAEVADTHRVAVAWLRVLEGGS